MIEWILIFAPIVFGFGSLEVINIMHAGMQDEEHGITHAIPSLLSIHFVYLTYAIVLGFSVGWIMLRFPVLLTVVTYISVVLLVGLAFLIWTREKVISEGDYQSFKDEFISQAKTPVVPVILVIMYATFLDVTRPLGAQIFVMTVGLIALSLITQLVWVAAGMVLDDDVLSEKLLTTIDHVFAGLFCVLALWVLLSNIL